MTRDARIGAARRRLGLVQDQALDEELSLMQRQILSARARHRACADLKQHLGQWGLYPALGSLPG